MPNTLDALRHGYADLGEVRLHYVEAGSGPLVVLLHGFPEFWFSWRHQITALCAAGFRVVAPDMRGYNLSSRPVRVADYELDKLARDVRELIHERGEKRACVAGHDWGGGVAWYTAMHHPDVVERLAILNAPHPRRFLKGMWSADQIWRSWYMFFFQLPRWPEAVLRDVYLTIRRDARPGAISDDELAKYAEAWSRPGAVRAAVNYYRASFRSPTATSPRHMRAIEAPTIVIWGERDRYLSKHLAEPSRRDVPGLEQVVRLPEASHWVQQDEPERVSQLLIDFFRPATAVHLRPARNLANGQVA